MIKKKKLTEFIKKKEILYDLNFLLANISNHFIKLLKKKKKNYIKIIMSYHLN
jgi:hypothetical protein